MSPFIMRVAGSRFSKRVAPRFCFQAEFHNAVQSEVLYVSRMVGDKYEDSKVQSRH